MTNIEFNSNFLYSSPAFQPLHPFFPEKWKERIDWPSLEEFNIVLEERAIFSAAGKKIKAVSQTKKSKNFEEGYEPRIYLQGELQTRLCSWHDFFNFMVWQTFPNLKAIMNKWQYISLKKRFPHPSNRTHLENLLTQFDEGGMLVLSANVNLTQHLKNHAWKKLFLENRTLVKNKMRFYVIGHAVYEKLIMPYSTITAGALIFDVEKSLFEKDLTGQIHWIDKHCSKQIDDENWSTTIKKLQPVPIFGIPGWYAENEQEDFYNNTQYFRPKS
jgi:hypothetical protein